MPRTHLPSPECCAAAFEGKPNTKSSWLPREDRDGSLPLQGTILFLQLAPTCTAANSFDLNVKVTQSIEDFLLEAMTH